MTSKLPDKPSELIRAGLEDLGKIEMLPEIYEVDMKNWHRPRYDTGLCAVCFAGGMMAMRLGVHPSELAYLGSSRFSAADADKLRALDYLRLGWVDEALNMLNLTFSEGLQGHYEITPYRTNQTQFKADMRNLADTLEGAGL